MVTPCRSNSSWFQPQTMLRPARPCVTWSMVAIALAPNAGVTSGTCTVEKIAMRFVSAPSAAPCVRVSNERP